MVVEKGQQVTQAPAAIEVVTMGGTGVYNRIYLKIARMEVALVPVAFGVKTPCERVMAIAAMVLAPARDNLEAQIVDVDTTNYAQIHNLVYLIK